MKAIRSAAIGALFLLVLASIHGRLAHGSSLSHQFFTVIGKQKGNPAPLWIRDSVTGAYGDFGLRQVFVLDTIALSLEMPFPVEIRKALEEQTAWEPMEVCKDSNGVFLTKSGLRVTPPARSKSFDSIVQRLGPDALATCASTIVRVASHSKHALPTITGAEGRLIWSHPRGLYHNYKLKAVHYFKRSRLLLVTTNQPMMGTGEDTMHGMLLFKLE